MYIDAIDFQPVTNREDFYQTLSFADDDTGDTINVSGIIRANPGAPLTSNNWKVTDGTIVTPSATSITIPAFPLTNQLSALALTVGTNLGILAGDFVTITDVPTAGANNIAGYVTSYVPATGAMVVQIGCTFEFEIRKPKSPQINQDYVSWYDFGTPNAEAAIIQAALGTGITFIDIATLAIMIPASIMRSLHGRTYLASMTMFDGVNTRQIFTGDLPVIYGGTT